jgi:hypothetical protein
MNGIRFTTCQPGCLNCCDQKGNVYPTEQDLKRAAEFTGINRAALQARYVYPETYK